MGSIKVLGIPRDSQDTVMVTSGSESEQGPLVDFALELNPLEDKNMDLVVRATVRPLKVIYSEVSAVQLFFIIMHEDGVFH